MVRSGKLGEWEGKRTSGSNTRIMHEGNAPSPTSLSRPHISTTPSSCLPLLLLLAPNVSRQNTTTSTHPNFWP